MWVTNRTGTTRYIMPLAQEGFDMRFSFCRFPTSDVASGNPWSYRVAVLAVSLGLLALVAGVISERSHREALAAPAADLAGTYSGGGNLVPVF